jgi:hypothetical protein
MVDLVAAAARHPRADSCAAHSEGQDIEMDMVDLCRGMYYL